MNTVTISGRLGQDPETFAPQGSEYTCLKFNIANDDESKKNDQGGYDNITSWFPVEYWTKNPQLWLQKLTKGCKVIIEASLKQDTWQNEQGENRSKVKLRVKRGTFPEVVPVPVHRDQPATPQEFGGQPYGGFDDSVPF